jgi:hypothetical protein
LLELIRQARKRVSREEVERLAEILAKEAK